METTHIGYSPIIHKLVTILYKYKLCASISTLLFNMDSEIYFFRFVFTYAPTDVTAR